ncbi:MAG TPA: hypothetical protein V6C97_31855 [Oculatellaceae cyanobacterium]
MQQAKRERGIDEWIAEAIKLGKSPEQQKTLTTPEATPDLPKFYQRLKTRQLRGRANGNARALQDILTTSRGWFCFKFNFVACTQRETSSPGVLSVTRQQRTYSMEVKEPGMLLRPIFV